jgi:hypothetical protein
MNPVDLEGVTLMSNTYRQTAIAIVLLAVSGCSQEGRSESAMSMALPTSPSASVGGGTAKETLSGPSIAGVKPEGQAFADMSQFQSGGSTILTVQIRKVNLPDGTVLAVSLHFTPVGSISLRSGEGSLTANLGHFGVSRDPVVVKNGTTTILAGGYFQ